MSIAKVPTGIPGLDVLTHGGLPKGRTTLITGRSGTCKSVLSLQIACQLARAGLKTMFVAVEELPEDHIVSGDSLNFGTSKLVEKKALVFTDLTRPVEGPTFVSGSYDLSGMVHRIEAAAREGLQAIVIDSVSALFSPKPPDEVARSHVFHLVHAFRRLGLTSVITSEAIEDYGALTSLGVEDFLCDLVVTMRNHVDGDRRRRSVEVHKYRRSPHYKGEFPATITHTGLSIFPLDAHGRRHHPARPERPLLVGDQGPRRDERRRLAARLDRARARPVRLGEDHPRRHVRARRRRPRRAGRLLRLRGDASRSCSATSPRSACRWTSSSARGRSSSSAATPRRPRPRTCSSTSAWGSTPTSRR